MKKIVFALSVMLFLAAPAIAAEVYVKSFKANIMSSPSFKAKIRAVAYRGAPLKKLQQKGKWIKVRYKKGKTGWVASMVVSFRPPMKRVSLLAKGKSLQKNARRRASAFTSVAAARGLTDYDRTRRGKDFTVDYDALDWLEKIEVTEEEALRFIEEGVSR